jgi:hypothetical protein
MYSTFLIFAQLELLNKYWRMRNANQVVTNLGLKYSMSKNSCRFNLQASVSLPSELIHGMLQKQSLLYSNETTTLIKESSSSWA